MSCLQPFTSQRVPDQDKPKCLAHAPQQCVCPSPDKATLHFESHHCEFLFDFYLATDIECFLRPPSDDKPNVDAHHVLSGFCVYHITDHEAYRTDPIVYLGRDMMANFFWHIFAESNAISAILSCDVLMVPLTDSEMWEFARVTTCGNCGCGFLQTNPKMRHHNHVDGRYQFVACCSCNLVLNSLMCIVFVDLCQFLATSLDNLVKEMRKLGEEKFANTIRHFGRNDV